MALSKRILSAAVLVAWLGSSGTAGAQEESSISANLAVTTDYVFRGYTQTGEDPAVQGGLDWADSSGWYVGTWASNIDFGPGDDASIEVDIYAGYGWEANDVSYDVGLL
ncbi:MAG: TorF family putative porin, partial [Gammaproteobacteria bacterium]|nr:TorF family putative porin [Gammaproteobacteria bacterium]